MNKIYLLLLTTLTFGCNENNKKEIAITDPVVEISEEGKKARQEEIIKEHLYECAGKYPLYSRERQKCLDAGLEKDPTIAYLWQQKAMPLFKQGKYEVGMEYIDKAVEINPERWQPYRAFIKVIFAKTYKAGITDFEDLLDKYGNAYVMDHTYKFHIGLSYLQLNELEKAEAIFTEDLREQVAQWGEDGEHHLDLFYYGISKYELGNCEEAIEVFDKALKIYPTFAEVQYYKAICLYKLERQEEAMRLMETAQANGKAGNTINEDNVIYERYPYQVRW
ncbi:tetratricopeptide repeat protein [Salinimicrobium terrae]|uniref:tetratricopeptide repeat protein n=1 Tax=Salinimicrobium terrae TaxID=470866 RepID=UPI000415CA5C|nr:tetratricopeptide repeat protein [Salinimicrobium terrae]